MPPIHLAGSQRTGDATGHHGLRRSHANEGADRCCNRAANDNRRAYTQMVTFMSTLAELAQKADTIGPHATRD